MARALQPSGGAEPSRIPAEALKEHPDSDGHLAGWGHPW